MTRIFVRVRAPGWHNWPDAPPQRAYLSYRHRHMFHYEVSMVVEHNERDVEFHDLMDEVQRLLLTEWGNWSCEKIATRLRSQLAALYGDERDIVVAVSEDGEAGAVVHG